MTTEDETTKLTDFEAAALSALLERTERQIVFHRDEPVVLSREYTGAGYYIELFMQGISSQLGSAKSLWSVPAEVEGVPFGVTVVLHPEQDDRMILELVCNGNEEFPLRVGSFKFL